MGFNTHSDHGWWEGFPVLPPIIHIQLINGCDGYYKVYDPKLKLK